ncbi:MAG: hypothetical protein ABSA53_20285 [Streptosporangiaceae bacterium]
MDGVTAYVQVGPHRTGVLRALDVTGPLVLVGHSSGGPCVRAFAALFVVATGAR